MVELHSLRDQEISEPALSHKASHVRTRTLYSVCTRAGPRVRGDAWLLLPLLLLRHSDAPAPHSGIKLCSEGDALALPRQLVSSSWAAASTPPLAVKLCSRAAISLLVRLVGHEWPAACLRASGGSALLALLLTCPSWLMCVLDTCADAVDEWAGWLRLLAEEEELQRLVRSKGADSMGAESQERCRNVPLSPPMQKIVMNE